MNISSSGCSISVENRQPVQGSWIPVSPGKPIFSITEPKICTGREGSQPYQENLLESHRFPCTFPQETQAHTTAACENFTNCTELSTLKSWNAAPAVEMELPNYNAIAYRKPSFDLEMGLDSIPFTQLLAETDAAFIASASAVSHDFRAASSHTMSAKNIHPEVSSSSILLKSQDLLLGSSQWTSAPEMNQCEFHF